MITMLDKIISMEQLRIIVVGAISSILAIITGYDSEDPSIVVDCSDPAIVPNVSVTER